MKTQLLTTALTLSLVASAAMADVPANVANRLGQDLTPMGAEKAGTESGVAAWSGQVIDGSALLQGYDGGALPNPYTSDKVLYTVTAANAGEYDSVLSVGQKALLATYPDTYKLNVYESRRSCTYPDFVYKAAKRNAQVGKVVDDGNGISESIMAAPFPIPSSAVEIVWNHTLRYRGERVARDFNFAAPTASGDFTLTDTRDEIIFSYSDAQNARAEDLDNISIWFVAYTSAPARRAGNVVLVHETLNMAKEGRKAWTYSPGTRRVRRAPNIAYDNPVTNGDGLATSDQYDGYNGAPDRYDWTVSGKMTQLSQQNNYNAVLTPYDQLLQKGHANADVMRYELRRQWVVEGNLKGNARHIYAKRVLRMDEDSNQMSAGEMYDGRGELWRIQEIGQAPDYRPEAHVCWTVGGEFTYDLLAGRYLGLGMKSGQPANVVTGLERLTKDYYTPANVRRLGR
ncbi:DUF1329 domain-containing protein [Alphaproteobacteria bacterium]|nr:DUF1329 domain-containing protein [Alphaproteobacteria bacterium]